MENLFDFKTSVSVDELDKRISNIAQIVNTKLADPYIMDPWHGPCNGEVKNPYPIVIITNGVATSGKDAVVEQCQAYAGGNRVYRRSIIDPVKEAVAHLLRATEAQNVLRKNPVFADDVITTKPDDYRELLHEVKEAWERYNGAATEYAVGEVLDALIVHNECELVFIDSRERNNIERIVELLKDCGVIVIKLLVTSERVRREDWKNRCDSNVCLDPGFYDIVIHNDGTIDELASTAIAFYQAIVNANRIYGIERPL